MLSRSKTCDSCSDCQGSNLDDAPNIKYNFVGDVDQDGLRNKYGYQSWNGHNKHEYAGNFLLNNMHDKGLYFIRKENCFSFFDGQFYNNKLEGYGLVIHDDGSVYEGLFKDNKRFGPGILTHTDGSQDVGFWNGYGLLRLSISASSEFIPTLCTSSFSKVKLLRFKTIVPAVPEKHDQAKNMMLSLKCEDRFFDSYPELYNYYVRNENSLFFDRRYYDLAQLGSEIGLIDVLEDESKISVNINDVTTEYEDPCLCVNARCVHINRLIDEMNFELEKIHNDILRLKKKLRNCAECCMLEANETEEAFVHEYDSKQLELESKKYPSEEILTTTDDVPSKFKVQKNLYQMKQETSIVNLNEIHGDVTDINISVKEEEEEKLYVHDDEHERPVEKKKPNSNAKVKTCKCTERHIQDVDYIISELEVLEKNEKFHEVIIQYLHNILCKEIAGKGYVDTPKTVQILVEHLLAWNNDHNIIDLMQHCFRYRNFENMLSFSIKSLLSGDRSEFGPMGIQEKSCINFLTHCGLDKIDEVKIDLMKYNINPDLSDARGNRGIHFAVTNNCYDVMRQLANSGANLNAFNDECLTPLLLSILKYIATMNAVVIWENAFLPEVVLNSEELEEVIHWRPHESLVNLREFVDSTHLISRDHSSQKMDYKSIEEIPDRSKMVSQSRKSSTARMILPYILSTMFVDDYAKYKKSIPVKTLNEAEKQQLESIKNTICTLLELGADPNVGELPLCPVLLSIYTKNVDLVDAILKHGADPNVKSEETLSALHILASLPFSSINISILEKFLQYSCDPNTKTASDFWLEQNEELTGELVEVEPKGKTALEMICMRKDFDEDNVEHQCNLVRTLIENGAICHHYYLGHTLLSIAVLRENVQLIKTLFPYVEGTKPLGYNMGNVLTIPGLNRFSPVKSFVKGREVIDTLVSLGINPFDPVYIFPNVFEFFAKGHAENAVENNRKLRAKLEAEYRKLQKSFTTSLVINNANKVAVAYMKEVGKKILTGIYQYKALKHLLALADIDCLNNNHAKCKAKLLTEEDAIECLKIFIHHENIEFSDPLKDLVIKVIEYINKCKPKPKARKKKKTKKNKKGAKAKPPLSLHDKLEKLKDCDFTTSTQLARYFLDTNPEKYEVCYHCLKKTDKKLVLCPLCGIGQFCSTMCNRFNKKTKSKHPCNILFYNNPTSKKFEFVELPDSNPKEISSIRGRRSTIEPFKQKSEKLAAKKSKATISPTSTINIVEEVNLVDEVTFDPCCVRKDNVFFLCEENEYWISLKKNCKLLCGVSDEEGDTKTNSQLCVCYDPNEEHPVPHKVEELVGNEETLKGTSNEDKNKKVVVITDPDVIIDHFNKFLERFKKKEPEQLEMDELEVYKTQRIKKYAKHRTQIKKNTISNDKHKRVIGSHRGLYSKLKQDRATTKKGRRKNDYRGNIVARSTKSFGTYESKSKNSKEGKPITQSSMKSRKKINKKGLIETEEKYMSEQLSSDDGVTNVEIDKYTNRKNRRKADRDSKPSSSNKDAAVRGRTKEKSKVIKNKYRTNQSKAHTDITKNSIKSESPERATRTSKKTKSDKEGKTTHIDSTKGSIKNVSLGDTSRERTKDETRVKKTKNTMEESKRPKKTDRDTTKRSFISDSEREGFAKTDYRPNKKEGSKKNNDKELKKTQHYRNNKVINQRDRSSIEKNKAMDKKRNKSLDKHKYEPNDKRGNMSSRGSRRKSKDTKGNRKPTESNTSSSYDRNHRVNIRKAKTKRSPERDDDKTEDRELRKKKVFKDGGDRGRSKGKERAKDQARETMRSEPKKGDFNDKEENKKIIDAWANRKRTMPKSEKGSQSHVQTNSPTSNQVKGTKATEVSTGLLSSSEQSNLSKFQKFPKLQQYFLELLAQYFPQFNVNGLLYPFACFVDGQLYYKFAEASPYYCRTYSTV